MPNPIVRTGLTDDIARQPWDVILIDAPEGQQPDSPGRQQSIFLASKLAAPGSTIFLHDANRPAEQAFAGQYLPPEAERLAGPPDLAVFTA